MINVFTFLNLFPDFFIFILKFKNNEKKNVVDNLKIKKKGNLIILIQNRWSVFSN